MSFIKARVAAETEIHADEASAWDTLHAHYEMKRINHQVAYSDDGAHVTFSPNFFRQNRVAAAKEPMRNN